MNYKILLLLVSLFACSIPKAQQYNTVFGHIKLVTELNNGGNFLYSIAYKGQPAILPSVLGFSLTKPDLLLNDFTLIKTDSTVIDQTWKPVWGEQNTIRNHYKELVFHLQRRSVPVIRLNIIFRIFENGMGFRYEFPKQDELGYFIVKDEHSSFRMSGDHKTFWIPGDYETNEYLYNNTNLTDINALNAAAKEKDIAVTAPIGPNAIQTPVQMKTANGLYINIHEAALVNYPAMSLLLDKNNLTLTSTLVPDAVGNKAYLKAPCVTPWRTIIVSDKAIDMLGSKIILNLNEPSKFENTHWIKPQKFIGMWWEMHVGKATWPFEGGKHGANTANVKRYIDFASSHGFDGVLVEGWNQGWEDWFGNWKEDVFDFVSPYPDYDIKELTRYAKERNVKIIMHHETSGAVTNYERRMDTAYRFMLNHGMNTVKTGYVGKIIPRGEHHDGQWMVNHYNRVAEKTASYQIMLDAHEPVHSTGLHRTYPNWMASEAARGTEFNNAPTLGIPPEHQVILPFTRLMGGPMDYTPGLFHFQLNQFESTRTQRVLSTLAKQLALYITMYSPLQMAADLPENYEKHMDAFQFIKDVPVDWSDTKILEAEPGDFLTIARKSKNEKDWFLGSITDENARQLQLDLAFLTPGKKYKAVIYKDGPDADYDKNPESYLIETKEVTNKTILRIQLARGGGVAISLFEQ
jgi:glucan 1,4-alpha-glucosidase